MTIQEIVSTQISAEVILHTGNVRAVMFGKVCDFGEGGKFIILQNKNSPDSIVFTEENISLIQSSPRHVIIYIS